MKNNYKKVVNLIKSWMKEDEPNANENWKNFQDQLNEDRVNIKSLKYRTILIIETDYDPSELGNVPLILDTVANGGARCIARKTKQK